MARGKNALILGPWPGGINQRDDPTEIADTELVDIVNFDVESTGALIPRRGWKEVAVTAPALKITPLTVFYNYLAQPKAIFARATNINAGAEATSFFNLYETLYSDNKTAAGANISRTGLFNTAFNYNKKIYFVPDNRSQAAGVGFSLNDVSNQDPVNVAAMPAGRFSFIMGDRAFIFNPDTGRLYWSKATDPTVWASPDGGFVDVEPSDEPFTDCVVARNTVYFVRSNGIYAFTFTSDPGIDGNITTLTNSEGAIIGVAYQNELILCTPRGIFKFLNGYLTLLTDKVDFGLITGPPSYSDNNSMTVIEHTLWVSTFNGLVMKHLAVNLRTGAVSRYDYTNVSGIIGKSISDARYTYFSTGDAVAVVTNQRSDTAVTAGGKDFGYSFTTKRLTLGTRLMWKRLINWLVDYNTGVEFHDGNDATKFFVRVGTQGEFDEQDIYTGQAKVSADSKEGRIDTPSLRFKDVQFGLQSVQAGNVNPNGVDADAGITVRGMMVTYSVSRETVSLQT